MKPIYKFFQQIFTLALIVLSLTPSTAAFASMKCNDLSPNYCLADGSVERRVFCQNSAGHTYEGTINCEGQWQGRGIYTWPSGQIYDGEWRNGKSHGHGTFVYKSGDKYVGGFRLDDRHGFGTYSYKDGGRYEGQYKNNKRHGAGKEYFAGEHSGSY